MEGERETQLTQMTNVAFSSSLVPAVNEEIILKQVLDTRRGHKTRVGHILSQRVHSGASSSIFRLERSTTRVDLAVKEYLRRSYEQNLQMYESHRMMQKLLAQLHPNIQFSMITRLEPFVPLGPPLLPDEGEDDANNAANLGD